MDESSRFSLSFDDLTPLDRTYTGGAEMHELQQSESTLLGRSVTPVSARPSTVSGPAKKIGQIALKGAKYAAFGIGGLIGGSIALTGAITVAAVYVATSPISSCCLAIIHKHKLSRNKQRLTAILQEKLTLLAANKPEGASSRSISERHPEPIREVSVGKELQDIESRLHLLTAGENHIRAQIAKNRRNIVASCITFLPVVGHLTAGVYMKYKNPDAQGAGDAVLQSCIPEGTHLIRSQFYRLNNSAKKNEYIGHAEEAGTWNMPESTWGEKITVPVMRLPGSPSSLSGMEWSCDSGPIDYTKPTMVLFHATSETATDLSDRAQFYRNLGFNIIAVTMGGYPGSDEGVRTSEVSSYQDANAVMEYLKEKGATDVAVQGLSVGGSLAFAAADLHPDIVKYVIAEQTFTNFEEVASNWFKNLHLPEFIARGAARSTFVKGEIVPGVFKDGKPYTTDGGDNVGKASRLQCPVFAVKAGNDAMMGRAKQKGEFSRDFADDLLDARYGEAHNESTNRLVVEGRHCQNVVSKDSNRHEVEPLVAQLCEAFSLDFLIKKELLTYLRWSAGVLSDEEPDQTQMSAVVRKYPQFFSADGGMIMNSVFHSHPSLGNDLQFMLAAVKIDPQNLRYAGPAMRENISLLGAAVKKDTSGTVLQHIDPDIRKKNNRVINEAITATAPENLPALILLLCGPSGPIPPEDEQKYPYRHDESFKESVLEEDPDLINRFPPEIDV